MSDSPTSIVILSERSLSAVAGEPKDLYLPRLDDRFQPEFTAHSRPQVNIMRFQNSSFFSELDLNGSLNFAAHFFRAILHSARKISNAHAFFRIPESASSPKKRAGEQNSIFGLDLNGRYCLPSKRAALVGFRTAPIFAEDQFSGGVK